MSASNFSLQLNIESQQLPADGMHHQKPNQYQDIHYRTLSEGYSLHSPTAEFMESQNTHASSIPPLATTQKPHHAKPSLFHKYKHSSRKHSVKVGYQPPNLMYG